MRRFRSFVLILGGLAALNLLFSLPHIFQLGFINDDTALVKGALANIEQKGFLYYFYSSYGPKVIRPFQLFGMYLDGRLFGWAPLGPHLVSLLWLAFGQAVLWSALRGVLGRLPAWAAVLPLSFSINGAEALYWLSDRHDLYLLFFFALGVAFAGRVLRAAPPFGAGFWAACLGLAAAQWGAFYSNEKGSVAPLALCLLAGARLALEPERGRLNLRSAAVLCAVSVLNTIGYFTLRFWVLREVVGGYNNSLLGENQLSVRLLATWFATLASLPFRQNTETLTLFAAWAGGPLLLFIAGRAVGTGVRSLGGARTLVGGGLLAAAVLAAAAPTLQYSLQGIAASSLNARMTWFPFIVISLAAAALGAAGIRGAQPASVKLALLVYIWLMIPGGRAGLYNFRRANEYSRQAVELYRRYCACVDFQRPQSAGLFQIPFGVNTFTEEKWLKQNAYVGGMPLCGARGTPPLSEGECLVEYQFGREQLQAVPLKMSALKLTEMLSPFGGKSLALPAKIDRQLRGQAKRWPAGECLGRRHSEARFGGWSFDRKSKQPPDLLVLLVDGRAAAATPTNIFRDLSAAQAPGAQLEELPYGFALAADLSALPAGQHELTLAALKADQDAAGGYRTRVLRSQLFPVCGKKN